MNDINEAISLLREEVGKHVEVEQSATAYLTNVFLETYAHTGEGDEDDPTPSIINDLPLDDVSRVVLIIAGCALAFQQESEEAYSEAQDETPEMSDLDKVKWESYLDGVVTLTSGLMGLALAVADSATASGELSIEKFLEGEGPHAS